MPLLLNNPFFIVILTAAHNILLSFLFLYFFFYADIDLVKTEPATSHTAICFISHTWAAFLVKKWAHIDALWTVKDLKMCLWLFVQDPKMMQ